MPMETEGGVMKVKGSRRLVRRLGLALAVTALMVPATAQAMTMNASYESGGSVRLYADDLHGMISPVKTQRLYADDLHASLVSAPVEKQRMYADDLHSIPPVSNEPGNYAPVNTRARPDLRPPVSEAVSADSTSSDWSVAIIGAAVGAFGVMLLGLTLLLAGRHGRKGRLAAT
jgi:hypothetical protein